MTHRERGQQLWERFFDVGGIGSDARIPPDVTAVVVDLFAELYACVLELELRDAGLDAEVEREGSP